MQIKYNVNINNTHTIYVSKFSLKEGLRRRQSDAYYIQGILCLIDVGQKQDFGEAAKYFRLAAKEKHFLATVSLQDMYKLGLGIITDHFETLKWQVKASNNFHTKFYNFSFRTLINIPIHLRHQHPCYRVWKEIRRIKRLIHLKDITNPTISAKRLVTFQEIKGKYDLFLFDMGGVVTDGSNPFPYAIETINQLVEEQTLSNLKKKVVFISNSARPKEVIKRNLITYGLKEELFDEMRDSYISVVTAGDFACARLKERLMQMTADPLEKRFVYHFSFGPNENKELLRDEDNLFTLTDDPTKAHVIVLSQFIDHVDHDMDTSLKAYGEALDKKLKAVADHVNLHKACQILCVNPDEQTPYGSGMRYCSGAFARRLREIHRVCEDQIIYCGKPMTAIYEYIFREIVNIKDKDRTVMIGDSLENDILGAQNFGIKSVLVLTGTAKHQIEQQRDPQEDIWMFLAKFYKNKKACPDYFMDSLTDDFSVSVANQQKRIEDHLI